MSRETDGWRSLEKTFFELCDLSPEDQRQGVADFERAFPGLAPKLRAMLRSDRREDGFLESPRGAVESLAAEAFDLDAGRDLADESYLTDGRESAEGFPTDSPTAGSSSPQDESQTAISRLRDPLLGSRLGAYRLLSRLGEGGMSVVYLAERDDGSFEGRCAVKILRHGLLTEALIERFGRERQILAQLRHPAITRLLDGGLLNDGRPFLVMELVDGRPIHEFCAEEKLSTRSIVELLIEIAAAVEHAHRRLVVHRDIKPANILVTAEGSPRLLDFGIARFDERQEPATTLGGRFLTPEYASPEQLSGGPITVGIDIFSLGLLAYELLSGSHPFEEDRTSRQGIARALREDDPPPLGRVAGDRLDASLRRDLEAIVSKAMRKDPESRYASMGEMGQDLKNTLESRPVSARRGHLLYRGRRWLRRHRLLAASLATVTALTTFGVQRIALERDRAELEARRQENVSQLLIYLLESADPVSNGESLTLSSARLVEQATILVDRQLQEDPQLRARFHITLGRALRNLGDLERAWQLFDKADRELEAVRLDPELRADLLFWLAELAIGTDRFAAAEQRIAELQNLGDADGLPISLGAIRVHALKALLFEARGEPARAAEELDTALDLTDSETDPRKLSWLLDIYARLDEGQTPQERLERAERAHALTVEFYGPRHTLTLDRLETVALAQSRAGHPLEARQALLQVLEHRRRHLGENHPSLASSYHHLAMLDYGRLELPAARQAFERALEIAETSLGRTSLHWAESAIPLADLYRIEGQPEKVLELLETAELTIRQRLGPGHRHMENVKVLQIESLLALGRAREAETLFQNASLDTPSAAEYLRLGALAAIALGDFEEATRRLDEADEVLATQHPLAGIRAGIARSRVLALRGQTAAAGELLRELQDRAADHEPQPGTFFLRVAVELAEWEWAEGKTAEAHGRATRARDFALELFGGPSTLSQRVELVRLATAGPHEPGQQPPGGLSPQTAPASELFEATLRSLPAGERSPHLERALAARLSASARRE